MLKRRNLCGWSIRWDDALAREAHDEGWWIDSTIAERAALLAAEGSGRPLVVDGVRRLDPATLYAEAQALAQSLLARGLKPGEVISFMLPNWHEAAVIYLAATLAGLVAHPIVPALRDREVTFMLQEVASKVIFAPARFRNFDYPEMIDRVNRSLVASAEVVIVRGDPGPHTAFSSLLAPSVQPIDLPHVDPDSVKLVLYTSGATGRPKGVLHSHNSINALATQIRQRWQVGADSCFFVPSPVTHIGGSIYAFEFPFLFGTTAVLQDTWNADEAVEIMSRERCTHMAGATPFLTQLLSAAAERRTRLPDLAVFICGGASVPASLIRAAHAFFADCIVTRVYGLTEVPVITVGSMTRADLLHAAETDGRIGIAQVRIARGDGGFGAGEGEVCARGPQMLVGYLWAEDERDAFDAEGFFHTGDIGRIVDEAFLVITGRAKDIIIRQGENIAPKEIEDLLAEHPDIAEVAVVGLPDPHTGERACAVIVPQGGARPDVDALRAYLGGRRVARFKVPEQVALRQSLPRNAAGKVLKYVLRDELIVERQAMES